MTLPRNTLLVGVATERLRQLPQGSVDCVVTSPPYFLLRDYGVEHQFGLEPTVEEWVNNLRGVVAEVARVLKPTGSLWLNLGDSYSRHARYGAPPKGLLLAPERLALALVEDGWVLRNKVIWAKPNPMPSSVGDRLSCTWEVVYHFVRERSYFYDLDAIREPHRSRGAVKAGKALGERPAWAGPLAGSQDGLRRAREAGTPGHVLGRNPGDVWRIATRGYRGAHFATFPEALVRRPILATCPEAVCTACGLPWRRGASVTRQAEQPGLGNPAGTQGIGPLVPCGCGTPTLPGVVMDCFFGTGTVGVVAQKLGREWLGIELNPKYADLARERLGGDVAVWYERAAPGLALAGSQGEQEHGRPGEDDSQGDPPSLALVAFLLEPGGELETVNDDRQIHAEGRRHCQGHGALEELSVGRLEPVGQLQRAELGVREVVIGHSPHPLVSCRRGLQELMADTRDSVSLGAVPGGQVGRWSVSRRRVTPEVVGEEFGSRCHGTSVP